MNVMKSLLGVLIALMLPTFGYAGQVYTAGLQNGAGAVLADTGPLQADDDYKFVVRATGPADYVIVQLELRDAANQSTVALIAYWNLEWYASIPASGSFLEMGVKVEEGQRIRLVAVNDVAPWQISGSIIGEVQ
jgi:hypothetical protein